MANSWSTSFNEITEEADGVPIARRLHVSDSKAADETRSAFSWL